MHGHSVPSGVKSKCVGKQIYNTVRLHSTCIYTEHIIKKILVTHFLYHKFKQDHWTITQSRENMIP